MNLMEILNYRERCIICGRDMLIKHATNNSLSCYVSDIGLRVRVKGKKGIYYLFDYNGTVNEGRRDFKDSFAYPFTFVKGCSTCKPLGELLFTLKSRSSNVKMKPSYYNNRSNFDHTTISNIKSRVCFYTFKLEMDGYGKYNIVMENEVIRYPGSEAFYHIHSNFIEDKTTFTHGKYSQSMDQLINIKSSSKNISQIKSQQDLIDKFKTYTLFS